MNPRVISAEYRESKELGGKKAIRIREFIQFSSTPIPKALLGGIALILGIVAYGLILINYDLEAFQVWIREDGLVEWLTFLELLAVSAYSFVITSHLGHSEEERVARRVWLFFGFLFLFGALEEISWGQRILGIESPEWFLKHNRQFETNIHNLVIYGVNLNKVIFGRFLGIMVLIYMLAMPVLYHFHRKFKDFMNRWTIPMPQNYQILLFIVVNTILQFHLGLTKKVSEMRELFTCFVFFLILIHPINGRVFPIKGLSFLRRIVFTKESKN